MLHRPAASQHACAYPTSQDAEDDVYWLQPRGLTRHNARKRSQFRAWLFQVSATVGVGVLVNVASSETAFAPVATAHAAVSNNIGMETVALPAVLPVDRAPLQVAAEIGEILRQQLPPEVEASVEVGAIVQPAPASDPEAAPASTMALEPKSSFDPDPKSSFDLNLKSDSASEERLGRDPNEPIQFGSVKIPRNLVETILRAASVTGVDPVYMMALADKESSFSMGIKARTSSAEGLFQFITRTWLEVVRIYGPKHGLVEEAALIEMIDGQPTVKDEATRERILGLRRNPYLSAIMAAEMLKRDRTQIERRIGRDLSRSEFYLAHFLGAQSAERFMSILDEKPKQSAPRIFRGAAKANRTLFFARKGRRFKDLTVAEVYDKIDRMIDVRLDRYTGVTNYAATVEAQAHIPGF